MVNYTSVIKKKRERNANSFYFIDSQLAISTSLWKGQCRQMTESSKGLNVKGSPVTLHLPWAQQDYEKWEKKGSIILNTC